jgi:XTP/dITP diphosphohydrolase
MNKVVRFVTSNKGKFDEVRRLLQLLNASIDLEQVIFDLPEVQSLDVRTVALDKAQNAWRYLQKPLLIDDGGIYLEKYTNFPGPLTKYVYQGIGFDGFWRLAQDDPRAYFLSCLVYIDGPTSFEYFEGISKGHIIDPTHVTISDKQLPFTVIFVPQGYNQVFADLKGRADEEHFNHRMLALKKFLLWFNSCS